MYIFNTWVALFILTTSSLTVLASSANDLDGQTSPSSRWSKTIPQPPAAGAPSWYTGPFQQWLKQEKGKNNPLVNNFSGNNLKTDAPLIKAYNQRFQEYEATQAKVASASAASERRLTAEKAQLEEQLEKVREDREATIRQREEEKKIIRG